jgi:hypothetical protein
MRQACQRVKATERHGDGDADQKGEQANDQVQYESSGIHV